MRKGRPNFGNSAAFLPRITVEQGQAIEKIRKNWRDMPRSRPGRARCHWRRTTAGVAGDDHRPLLFFLCPSVRCLIDEVSLGLAEIPSSESERREIFRPKCREL